MALNPVSISLDPALFTAEERVVVRSGKLVATAFRFHSGVAGLRIDNGSGTVVLLPFQGQQIWDAHFLGRRLTMRSMFDEPQPTRDYLKSYGALFIHCGGTAMGNPGPADTHPLHGELPSLPFAEAWLNFGADDGGTFVELTGTARDTRAFDHDFLFRPRVRLHEGSTSIEVTPVVENRARRSMAFLYLAHINFRPVDEGVLIDTVRDDVGDVALRPADLAPDAPSDVRGYHEAVAADPSLHRLTRGGMPVEPELVLTMRAASGEDGLSHALHRHPDGTADFVTYRPAELPYLVRWLTRGPDQDALGLALPATAPPDGLVAAKRNGQIVWIKPGACFSAELRFGALDAPQAEALNNIIASIRDGRTLKIT